MVGSLELLGRIDSVADRVADRVVDMMADRDYKYSHSCYDDRTFI
ncbi:unnamed protein product [uncultured virus]|nr:unnamed protein product [uncultured virus]